MNESSENRPDEYDRITYHHWQEFEIRRLKRSSDDFQQLFEDIMVRARPGFIRVRPYGNIGDRKCDGLFRDDSIFFQVYSPDQIDQAKVQKKINEDLDGAVEYWGDAIKTWSFVYNVRRGVPPDILETLQEKQKQYPSIKIDHLSNDDLWEITSGLSIEHRNEILGLPPSSTTRAEKTSAFPVNNQKCEINWCEICRELLRHWKGLTTNALTTRNGVRFQLDEMFVPLGVVERRQTSRHSPVNGSPEQGSELYEEKVTPISQDNFFEQVLRQRQSKNSQGSRIAIIGEPGAGKTTQLQKIGDWILKETDEIPIWVPLAALGTKSLKEYLLNDWLQTATEELEIPQEYRDELGQLLKTGKVWLLLDGVDEMTVADALYQIASQMHEGWLRNVRVVLTCRLNVWDAGKNYLDSFDVYRNLDFDYPSEVHLFIDKWFVTEPNLQQKLKLALEQPGQERIRDMVKNPLRLTLLCYSWQLRQGELPETKAGLYEWFVDTFYEWNKGKVPTKLDSAKRKELNRALGELAKGAIDQESSRFRMRERFINSFLGDADDEDSLFYADDEDSLFYLALRLGWLNCVGVAEENPLEDVYAFFHPTFQEYFAALAIEDWDDFLPRNHVDKPIENRKGECRYRIFEPQWKAIACFWVEQNMDCSDELIKSLYSFDSSNDKEFDYYYYTAKVLSCILIIHLPCQTREHMTILNEVIVLALREISYILSHVRTYFDKEEPKLLGIVLRSRISELSISYEEPEDLLDPLKLLISLQPHEEANFDLLERIGTIVLKDFPEHEIWIKETLGEIYAKYKPDHWRASFFRDQISKTSRNLNSYHTILLALERLSKKLEDERQNTKDCDQDDLIQIIDELDEDKDYSFKYINAVEQLTKIVIADKINQKAIKFLLDLLLSDTKKHSLHMPIKDMYIFRIIKHCPKIVTSLLREYIDEKGNFNREIISKRYYKELLFYCAQNMSYPDFYRAWYSPSSVSAELPVDDGEMK